jgi:hypothetical protein
MQIIPAHRPGVRVAGTPVTLRYRTEPQGHALSRLWAISFWQGEPAYAGQLVVTLPSGATAALIPVTLRGFTRERLALIREDLTLKSDAEGTIPILLTNNFPATPARILSVACWEMPRTQLTLDSYDRGVDVETCQAGQPIYDSINQSLGAIAEHWARTWPRRTHIQWSGPSLSQNGSSFVDLFTLSIPVLPHKTYQDSTTLECKWGVWYSTDAGVAGEARITTDIDGNSDTIVLPEDTNGAFVSGTITARCGDPSRPDGLVSGGSWEGVQVAIRTTSGAGSVHIDSVMMWEPVTVLSYLMTEDGDYLLQEDGSRIVIENA